MGKVFFRRLLLTASVAALLLPSFALALQDGQCLTPPMGWNSWNHYGCANLSQAVVIATAKAFKTKHPANWEGRSISLQDAGYNYVNLDDCWGATARDANGKLQANTAANKFPSCTPANGGMKWLTDSIHRMGLKIGIYGCAGTRTCAGTMPGGFDNEVTDAKSYVDWGFDLLKYDFCNVPASQYYNQVLYVRMRNALWAAKGMQPHSGPLPITFSICEWAWNQVKVWTWSDTIGHLWRTTHDISANWSTMVGIIDQNIANQTWLYSKKGNWPDYDMFEVGRSAFDPSSGQLYEDQAKTHFSIWCMAASPLLLGNDVTTMSDAVFNIITNRELIALNQDSLGWCGMRRRVSGNVDVWVKKLSSPDTNLQRKWAVTLFNRGTAAASNIAINWSDFGETTASAPYAIRNLWTHTTLNGTYTSNYTVASVPAHGVVTLLFQRGGFVGVNTPGTAAKRCDARVAMRRGQQGVDMFIPVSNSTVQIFDIQGKELASFATTDPAWYPVKSQARLNRTCLVRVKTPSGMLVEKMVLAR
ncbi:MAG: glycoside hydrolase family 27 protein [Chitinispirillaceae bacterium]|nr:glycoside hydrolase family 27 protein [Chitinispirillaceae bacterium]